jgi:hypothetical protein
VRGIRRFWWLTLRERCRLEDLRVDGRILLKTDLAEIFGAIDWINLAQDRDK